MVECFDQSLMAGKIVSKLIPKSHVLPATNCRGNIVRGVLTLTQKLLLLRVRLSIF